MGMTGRELKEWRRRRGWTQEELARRLGVIRVTVARWETGARPVPPYLRLALRGLEIEMEEDGHGLAPDGDVE